MRLVVCVLVSLLCAFRSASASDLELTHARIYTAPDQPPIADGTILIHDGSIVAVGPATTFKLPRTGRNRVIDCTGMTLTAGFWNSHVHIFTKGLLHAERSTPAALHAELQRLFTRWGFTTVFDIASVLANTNLIRSRIADGTILGPRIFTVGEPFFGKGGTPIYIRDFLAENDISIPEVQSTPQAVARVHDQIHGGADAIKIFANSIEAHSVLLMPADLADAIVMEAHREGKLVFSHVSDRAGIELSLAGHADILAHVSIMDGPWPPELIARMKAANISLTPTLTLFDFESRKLGASPQQTQQWINQAVSQLHTFAAAGGNVLFGTDIGYTDHADTTEEFSLMAKAGMTFPQILSSLTTNPAQRFGQAAHSGRIAPGMDADLVVLQADPARDITALSRVVLTIRGGRLIFAAPQTVH